MSLYNELMGSFLRTGNYPLEANYIFPTETSLKEFYKNELNAATLHKGLLRIVEDDGNGQLALYWVSGDTLEITKLISGNSLVLIFDLLTQLGLKLNKEIADRTENTKNIYGTEDSSLLPYNDILSISNAILDINNKLKNINVSNLKDAYYDPITKSFILEYVLLDGTVKKISILVSDIFSNLEADTIINLWKVDNTNHVLNISNKGEANISLCKTTMRRLGFSNKCIITKLNAYKALSMPSGSEDFLGMRYCHILRIYNNTVLVLYTSTSAIMVSIGTKDLEACDSWNMQDLTGIPLNPDEIIYISFSTNTAANKSVKTRLLVTTGEGEGYETDDPATVTTGHSFRPIFKVEAVEKNESYNKQEIDSLLNNKLDLLQSGVNLKTINNISLLGSGNIQISGSGVDKEYIDTKISELEARLIAKINQISTDYSFLEDLDNNPLTD